LPTDIHHVLKLRKDSFRGVDRIDYKKATFAKQMPSPYRRRPKMYVSVHAEYEHNWYTL